MYVWRGKMFFTSFLCPTYIAITCCQQASNTRTRTDCCQKSFLRKNEQRRKKGGKIDFNQVDSDWKEFQRSCASACTLANTNKKIRCLCWDMRQIIWSSCYRSLKENPLLHQIISTVESITTIPQPLSDRTADYLVLSDAQKIPNWEPFKNPLNAVLSVQVSLQCKSKPKWCRILLNKI